jgi:hypothetical protein
VGHPAALGVGVEIGDRDSEHFCDLLQTSRRNAVGAGLVFLDLLERHVQHASEFGLGHSALEPQGSHALCYF